jgi:hypothetical protein
MGVNSNGTVMMDQGVFENLGSVTWDTTAKTTGFTAVSGNGYFVNTTSGAITVTLPSSPSAGDVVGIKDYANTADTNAITIGRNGSNIDGVANDFQITTEGLSALLVYVDATKGWLITNSSQASDISEQATFITATGGTITTSGDYKIHTFTGPGTFCVSTLGNSPTNPLGGPSAVEYLVVAGGAAGGSATGANAGAGGGGAGGHRSTYPSPAGSTPVTIQGYPISVGAGGAAVACSTGNDGSNSIFSTITSTGGGGGGHNTEIPAFPGQYGRGRAGGSGGGGQNPSPGGAGNTPPVSPPQGNAGGNGANTNGGGGGGSNAAGSNAGPGTGGAGGAGSANSINGSPVTRAGGGGGGIYGPGSVGSGGAGGGGAAGTVGNPGTAGTANTGGGGGGTSAAGFINPSSGGAGGSGIVIIRYKYQ